MLTPEERWEKGIPHHKKSLEIRRAIKLFDSHGEWDFGGDGDNGENLLYILDAYFEAEEDSF